MSSLSRTFLLARFASSHMTIIISTTLIILAAMAVFPTTTLASISGPTSCPGSYSPSDTNVTFHYKAASNTCVTGNGAAAATGDIIMQILTNSGGNTKVYFAADNDLNGTPLTTDHLECTIANNESKAAGVACEKLITPSGSYTNTITANVAAGKKVTMTFGYTVVAATSATITSASFSVTTTNATDENAAKALQASVSRSQTTVVLKNINSRVDSSNSSAPRQVIDDNRATSFSNPSNFSDQAADQSASIGSSMRELAMLASFNTSNMVLAAAGDTSDPTKGPDQRQNLSTPGPFTVWGHGSYTSVDNDRNITGDDNRYDGGVWGYNLGVDYEYSNRLIAGVSLGYAETDITTTFNTGTYEETTYTLSPYAMYRPIENALISVIAGYSMGRIERTRDTTVSSKADSDMWFASVSGAYTLRPAEDLPLDIKADVSFLASQKFSDGYTESDGTNVDSSTSNTRQLKTGLEAAYSFAAADMTLQPFVKTDFVYDFMDEINGDNGAFNLGGGLRIASGETGLSGSIEGEGQLGRDDYTQYTIAGLIAYSFNIGDEGTSSFGIAAPYVSSNFNPDGGQQVGTGITFSNDLGNLNAKIGLTHNLGQDATSDTVGRISAQLKF